MLFSLVLLFELLEIIVLTMKKLFTLSFALHFRVRLDCSLPEILERPSLKNLSNLNYLFVSFFIRFSMTILHHLMLYRFAFQRFYHLAPTSVGI